jgi:uncharacterized coiled-coil protein SlyX
MNSHTIDLATMSLVELKALVYDMRKDRDRLDDQIRTVETTISIRSAEAAARQEITPPPHQSE